MYHGEAAIHQNSINMFLQNAKDFRIKQLADCSVTESAFDKYANSGENAKFDYKGNIKT
jgi:hypothetical protein